MRIVKPARKKIATAAHIILVAIFSFAACCAAQQDNTPLDIHQASKNGDVEAVKEMLNNDPEIVNKRNENGETPLHWAAIKGQANVINLLLAFGADPAARDDSLGGTPLHWAAINNRLDVIKLLLANQADINMKTSDGWTALHIASFQGHKDIVDFLIAFGADINARDNENMTPMDRAGQDRSEIIEMLAAKGADIAIAPETPDLEAAVENLDIQTEIIEEEKARLDIKQDVTEEKVEKLKNRISELEQGVEEADQIIKEVRSTIAESKLKDEELAEQRKYEIENVKKAQDGVIVRLKAQLAAAETDAFNMKRRLREAEKYKTDLETEKRLSRELWLKAREHSQQVADIQQKNENEQRILKSRISELQKQIDHLEKENTTFEKENLKLKFALNDANSKLSGAAQRGDHAQAVAATNATEITKLQHALLNAGQTLNHKTEELETAESKIATLETACAQKDDFISNLDEKVKKLNAQLEVAARTINETEINAKTQTEAADIEVAELKKEITDLQKTLVELRKEQDETEQALTAEKTVRIQKESELLAAMAAQKNLTQTCADLRQSVRMQEERMQKLLKETGKTEELNAELENERRKNKRLMNIMETESAVRIKAENDLAATRKASRHAADQYEKQIETLQNDLMAARDTIQKLRAETERVMTEKSRIEHSYSQAQNRLTEKDKETASLKASALTLKQNISQLSAQTAAMKTLENELQLLREENTSLEKKAKLEASARLLAEMNTTALKKAGEETVIELKREIARLERDIRELKSAGRRLWSIFEETSKSTGLGEQLKERRILDLRETFNR